MKNDAADLDKEHCGDKIVMTLLRRACFLVMLCGLCTLFFAKEAGAQCSARDVLRSHPSFTNSTSPTVPLPAIQSGADVVVWKTIKVGNLANTWALYLALYAADCSLGNSVEEIFIQRGFTVSAADTNLDLVVVSVSELGITTETASLKEIYSQAQKLGLALAAPEVGPQLRLQYFDQPMGEFLNIAMVPIASRGAKLEIFVVCNGGAGLLLIGTGADANEEFVSSSRFVFVRPAVVATAHQ